MSARKIQEQKAIAREMFVEQAAHAKADVSASPPPGQSPCASPRGKPLLLLGGHDESVMS